jgi:hypothetical protein
MSAIANITSIAKTLIDDVAGMFDAEETLRRLPQGFEWGKTGGRQRLWWESPTEGSNGGPDLFRVRIFTEVAPLQGDPDAWPEELCTGLLDSATDNLWGGLVMAEEMEGHLCLAGAISGHTGNVGYLPRVIFRAMAAQAAVREALFESGVGAMLAGRPGAGTAADMRELAESISLLLDTAGDEIPMGVESDMAFLTDQFENFPCLMCNGDAGGLSAEFPFGEESSLVRIDVESVHPLFGPAINLSLTLPLDGDDSPMMMRTVLELNHKEQTILDVPWSLGSWHLDLQVSPRIGYRIWLPYAMFQKNLLINLAVGMVARARRCCESIQGMTFQEAYPLAEAKMAERYEELLALLGEDEDEEEGGK